MVASASAVASSSSGTQSQQPLSAKVKKTIQSIKEIVGSFSDSDIYMALKESNMDPNETAQKLLNQDPFHEVRRRKDRKKEGTGYMGTAESRRGSEDLNQGYKGGAESRRGSENFNQGYRGGAESRRGSENFNQGYRGAAESRRGSENFNQGYRGAAESRRGSENFNQSYRGAAESGRGSEYVKQGYRGVAESGRGSENVNQGYRGAGDSRRGSDNFNQGVRVFTDRSARRGGYIRHAAPSNNGPNLEFRVVRDNRVNGNTAKDPKSDLSQSSSSNGQGVTNVKGSDAYSGTAKASAERNPSQNTTGPIDSQGLRQNRDANLSGTDRRTNYDEKRAVTPSASSRVQGGKPNISQSQSVPVIGVYSSSTDPVHVPSPDSRPSAPVGAIKREVGVVGGRRQTTGSPRINVSVSTSTLGKDSSLTETFQPFLAISKTEQASQANPTDSGMSGIPVSKPFLGNQYNSRTHQQATGHQKASQHNKEWKPKSSQKSAANGPGVIGTPKKSSSPVADTSKDSEPVVVDLHDKLSLVNVNKNQNVIIAQHIRVPETDRCRLTFGSFGVELDSTRNFASGVSAFGSTEENNRESTSSGAIDSMTVSAPESTGDDASGTKHDEISDEKLRYSGSNSPASGGESEHQLPDKSPSPQNMDNYADMGLVQESNQSYDRSDSQQQQDPSELQSFQAYDSQTGYDMSYFRPSLEETVRGQGLPSPQESLASHTANSIPASTMPTLHQQQHPQMAQLYPQVHMQHYTNMLPYRQFVSPVYVPQMAMPGYSSNHAYPHPSNGSSYVLMPGGSSHLNTNGLKYGVQQFKTVTGSSPSGFANYATPTGYTINATGVVGNGTGLEDTSRIKYKDGNLYVPNPQAETSEMWVQNPRELPSMQSAQYYQMQGQTPHAAAYLPSHAGHASFNAAAQSSHMQYPGLYPQPQPAGMANPHHLGSVMGGNIGVGVGVATAAAPPGAQVGGYHQQQPQLSHLNWTTNF
ncbi:GBF-interacting protein 1-like [Linum perenne]